MELFGQISFDEIVASLVICMALRETMIRFLPDRIAGPGGWLIDTRQEEV